MRIAGAAIDVFDIERTGASISPLPDAYEDTVANIRKWLDRH